MLLDMFLEVVERLWMFVLLFSLSEFFGISWDRLEVKWDV